MRIVGSKIPIRSGRIEDNVLSGLFPLNISFQAEKSFLSVELISVKLNDVLLEIRVHTSFF